MSLATSESITRTSWSTSRRMTSARGLSSREYNCSGVLEQSLFIQFRRKNIYSLARHIAIGFSCSFDQMLHVQSHPENSNEFLSVKIFVSSSELTRTTTALQEEMVKLPTLNRSIGHTSERSTVVPRWTSTFNRTFFLATIVVSFCEVNNNHLEFNIGPNEFRMRRSNVQARGRVSTWTISPEDRHVPAFKRWTSATYKSLMHAVEKKID